MENSVVLIYNYQAQSKGTKMSNIQYLLVGLNSLLGHTFSASWQFKTLLISSHHLLAFSVAQRLNMALQARDQHYNIYQLG